MFKAFYYASIDGKHAATSNKMTEENIMTITVNLIRSAAAEAIMASLNNSDYESADDFAADVNSTEPDVYEVIYNHDALEVIGGSEFNDYSADDIDFSCCDNAMACVVMEAQALVTDCHYSVASDIQTTLCELAESIFNEDWKENYEVSKLQVLSYSVMNSFPHEREEDLEANGEIFTACVFDDCIVVRAYGHDLVARLSWAE